MIDMAKSASAIYSEFRADAYVKLTFYFNYCYIDGSGQTENYNLFLRQISVTFVYLELIMAVIFNKTPPN